MKKVFEFLNLNNFTILVFLHEENWADYHLVDLRLNPSSLLGGLQMKVFNANISTICSLGVPDFANFHP